jgi:hypothetical protein
MAINRMYIGEWQGLPNIGNVRELLLWPTHEVVEINDSFVYVKDNTTGFQLDFGYLSANWQETEVDSDYGKYWACNLSFSVPIVSKANNKWFYDNRNKDFVALWRDGNNNYFRSGTVQNPLKLEYTKVIGLNTIQINLVADLASPTHVYDPSVAEENLPDLLLFIATY